MLLEWILTPIFWIPKTLLSFIPTFEMPEGFLSSFSIIANFLGNVGYFLPLGTITTIISLLLTFHLFRFGVSAFNWLVGKIPTIN